MIYAFYADLALWLMAMVCAALVAPLYVLATLIVLWVAYFCYSVRKMIVYVMKTNTLTEEDVEKIIYF